MQVATPADAIMDVSKRWVRVTSTQNGFIEFDFAIGDPAMSVELILPKPAFEEFCRMNGVVELAPDGRH